VVIDMPATGHALAVTSVPRMLRRLIPGGPLHEALGAVESRLRDPAFTGALVVSLPEVLPATEAVDLAASLAESGVSVVGTVFNRCIGARLDEAECAAMGRHFAAHPGPGRETLRRLVQARGAREILKQAGREPLVDLPEAHSLAAADVVEELTRVLTGEASTPSEAKVGSRGGIGSDDGADESAARAKLRDLLEHRKVLVCCGAGGVGKTTASAALAVAATRLGRRVLVLTIDPSKRLAQCLGVERNPPGPVPLPRDRLRSLGLENATGTLHAWMLDPKQVADSAVDRLVKDPSSKEGILRNPVYRHATALVSGMQEYTAMEALHGFLRDDSYDLIILDTPPSRHALDFLEAPSRLSAFLDGRIFRLFLPKAGGMVRRAASSVVQQVLTAVFGREFASDLVGFLGTAARLLSSLKGDVLGARDQLASARSGFLVVTSPAPAALDEARFLRERLEGLGVPFEGILLNRSLARWSGVSGRPPEDPALLEAWKKLSPWALREELDAERHHRLAGELRAWGGAGPSGGPWVVALPPASLPEDEGGTLGELASDLLTTRA
jgi:anion-transporting  ArsA/GET3 family ATPase